MNDFLKAMGQFGMEGLGLDHEENVSLEQEMNEEIAMEAELDESYAQMDFANIVASTSQCEAILTAMAEREVGLESNEGRDAGEIYKEFGLEAVKDVAMRKVYSGFASLKALINTCISWLKQLVGISVASKKVFGGLQKKAKSLKKQLGKVQSKVSEKLSRDMPDYVKAMNTIITKYYNTNLADEEMTDKEINILKQETKAKLNRMISADKKANEKMSDILDDLKDEYDKGDTTEYEGSKCFSHINNAIIAIEQTGKAGKAADDMAKKYNKEIKQLEKVRNDLTKKDGDKGVVAKDELQKYLNIHITHLTKRSNLAKAALREYVKVADDCLTMAKGVYASLV